MQPTIFDTPGELASAAAQLMAEVAAQATTGRRVSIGLAGGSTPEETYRVLAHRRPSWAGVDLWLGDERWVAHDSPESNGRMALAALGEGIPLHRPRWSEFLTAPDSAAHYEALLRRLHGDRPPDLVLLGMGADGHTASLFPDTDALHAENRLFVANWVDSLDVWRLTATFDLIAAARTVLILTAGESKAATLQAVLEGPEGVYPIQRVIAGGNDVRLFIDRAAASRLSAS